MQRNKDHFSVVLGVKDGRDKKIIQYTVGMVMGLNLSNFILRDKEVHDKYFTKLIEIGTSLQKANAHIRKYIREEEKFLKDYEEECNKSKSKTLSSTTAVDLTAELDGFLSQFKASLDTLAQTFEPMLGIDIKNWGKKKDKVSGEQVSGLKVIHSLERNLGVDQKKKAKHLIGYLSDTSDWVTAIVKLRDDANHKGGIKGVTNVLYDPEEKVVYPQMFKFTDGGSVLVKDFMLKTIEEIIEFVACVLAFTIEIKLPGNDMFVMKNQKEDFPPFVFGIKKKSP